MLRELGLVRNFIALWVCAWSLRHMEQLTMNGILFG
jgi:hypothetical protein